MEADAEPRTFLILISYVPVLRRVASLIRTAEESVVLSTDKVEEVTSSVPSFNHSMLGRGLAMSPTRSLTEAPALY